MPNTPEGKVKAEVKKVFKAHNIWSYMPVQNGMGCVGIPDLIACVPLKITKDMVGKTIGVFAGVETKAPGKIKNTTENQRRNLRAIGSHGGMAVVADRADLVEAALECLKQTDTTMTFIPE